MVDTDPERRSLFWLCEKDIRNDMKFEDMNRIASQAHLSMYLFALHHFHRLHDDRTLHGLPILDSSGAFPSLR